MRDRLLRDGFKIESIRYERNVALPFLLFPVTAWIGFRGWLRNLRRRGSMKVSVFRSLGAREILFTVRKAGD